MMEEFAHAYKVIQRVLFQRHDLTPWHELFEPGHFFEVAKGWYVQVRRWVQNSSGRCFAKRHGEQERYC